MVPFFLSLFAGAASAAAPDSAPKKASFVSHYTRLNQCHEMERARAGEDWVYFRCVGFAQIPVWYVCTDSARCHFGFGPKPNVVGWFGIMSGKPRPIEWRGPRQAGKFEPAAVIMRLPSAGGDTDSLVVFRLRADGTSCIVGEAKTNIGARKIADKSSALPCVSELDPRFLP